MDKYSGSPFAHAPYYDNGANPLGRDRLALDMVVPASTDLSHDHPGSWLGVLIVLIFGAIFILF